MLSAHSCEIPAPQVNSEEHDNTRVEDLPAWDRRIPEDIAQVVGRSQEVLPESITVWVDPLDATQEYTGGRPLLLRSYDIILLNMQYSFAEIFF